MKHRYCTLFDSFYLSRGLALIDSLKQFDPDFSLLIFAMDDLTKKVLLSLKDPALVIKGAADLEDAELLKIKASRNVAEYFWTCTPKTILYALQTLNWEHCTYIDADIYFFSDPDPLFDGVENILLVPHRFSKKFSRMNEAGKYCVQFNFFRNNAEGLKILGWWKDACLAWCFDRYEDGKFGDQKYLDDWTERFQGVLSLPHEGGGVAPWNLAQYEVSGSLEQRNLEIKKISDGHRWPIVFYHFHALKFYTQNRVQLGRFQFPQAVIQQIYAPYIKKLWSIEADLMKNWKSEGYQQRLQAEPGGLRPWLSRVRDRLRRKQHIYPISQFVGDTRAPAR